MRYTLEALPGGTIPSGTHVLFVHAVDVNGKVLWTDDHEPPQAVGTWKPGTPVEYTRTMFVPRTTPAGPLQIVVGLYAPGTGARVALRGETTESRAYRVATLEIGPDPAGAFVAYTDGWHNPEASETLGREWRWSKGTGHLAFRNPMKAADLWLELDQPVPGLASPQQVEIKVGGAVLDSFTLDNQQPVVRRIAVGGGGHGHGGHRGRRGRPPRVLRPGLDAGPQEQRPPGTWRACFQRLPRVEVALPGGDALLFREGRTDNTGGLPLQVDSYISMQHCHHGISM